MRWTDLSESPQGSARPPDPHVVYVYMYVYIIYYICMYKNTVHILYYIILYYIIYICIKNSYESLYLYTKFKKNMHYLLMLRRISLHLPDVSELQCSRTFEPNIKAVVIYYIFISFVNKLCCSQMEAIAPAYRRILTRC